MAEIIPPVEPTAPPPPEEPIAPPLDEPGFEPPPVAPPPPPVGGDGLAEEKIKRLEQLQLKQVQVLKAVVELLIERGYIEREEYRQKVEK